MRKLITSPGLIELSSVIRLLVDSASLEQKVVKFLNLVDYLSSFTGFCEINAFR